MPYQITLGNIRAAIWLNNKIIVVTPTILAHFDALKNTSASLTVAEANRQSSNGNRYFNMTRMPYPADGEYKSPIASQSIYAM